MSVDPKTLRLVVLFLGVGLLALIAATTVLAALHTAPPQALDVALGTDLGALAALFVQPHSSEAQPVTVVNDPVDPVPTSDVPLAPTKKTTARRHRQSGVTDLQEVFAVLLFVGALLGAVLIV